MKTAVCSLGVDIVPLAIVIVHSLAWGWMFMRLLRIDSEATVARATVGMGIGLSIFGFELFCLGHAGLVNREVLYVSSVLALIACIANRHILLEDASKITAGLRRAWNTERFLTAYCLLFLIAVIISGMRPSMERDELGYHWPTPLLWAQQGKWVASPFRLSNGTAMMEMLYTVSALWNSSTAAHWTHSLFLVILIATCATLARRAGGSAVAAAVVALACPVIVQGSSSADNDLAAGALGLIGFTALFVLSKNKKNDTSASWSNYLAGGIAFAGAYSVKPFLIVALGMAVLLVALSHRSMHQLFSVRFVCRALLLIAPTLLAAGLWIAHTKNLLGKPIDPRGMELVTNPLDWRWQHGSAAGRIPSVRDIAEIPLIPIIATFAGQHEPFGGRLDPLTLAAPCAVLLAWRHMTHRQQLLILQLVTAAIGYFLILSPVLVKTRFHLFVWACCAAVGGVGYTYLKKRGVRRFSPGILVFDLLALLGMRDGLRILLQGIQWHWAQ